MSRKKRIHSVMVERAPGGTDASLRRNRGMEEIYGPVEGNSVRGLMEPRARNEKTPSDIGEIVQSEWVFTWWGGETILVGDRITWLDTGKVLMATENPTEDLYRPGSRIGAYQSIDLVTMV